MRELANVKGRIILKKRRKREREDLFLRSEVLSMNVCDVVLLILD